MSKETKKTIKTLIRLSALALTGMYAVNKLVQKHALDKHILKKGMGHSYPWKYGDVYYHVSGTGSKKMLLIHDANTYASSYEWSALTDYLKDDYTLYALDLPGCGRSDKPAIMYTNYVYVDLITHFIKDIIQEPTEITATGLSASFAVTAALADKENITKINMINPWSPKKLAEIPTSQSKILGSIMAVPVLGTFVYNMMNSRSNLEYLLDEKCFYNPFKVRTQLIDACYEAAHLRESGSGRYMQAALDGKYLNWNINRALQVIDIPMTIIYGENLEKSVKSASEYAKLNHSIQLEPIFHAKMFPQLEEPGRLAEILNA